MLEQGKGSNFNFMKYADELTKSMDYLSKDPRTIFIGQSVAYSGNSIFNTLKTISKDRKIETPVFDKKTLNFAQGLNLLRL